MEAALASFLAPFLPYLVKSTADLAEDAARKMGAEAWKHAAALWERLRPGIESRPAALEAAEDVAARPADDRAKASFELQLEKLLANDPALAKDVARLWEDAKVARVVVAAGDRSIAVGGDASGVFVSGDHNRIEK